MSVARIDFNPPPRTLRQFGLIGLVAFPALAVLVYFQVGLFSHIPDGGVWPTLWALAALAVYCGLFAAVAPKLLWPLYVLMSVVFYPVGVAVFHIVMAVVFYGVIAPVGIVFRIIGRDALSRKFDPKAATHWIKRHPPDTIKRYFRQF